MTQAAAPSLSTAQDESTFEFDKVTATTRSRPYFGPIFSNQDANEIDLNELIAKVKDYYSIAKVIDFLKQKNEEGRFKYKAITLQFADKLISDSAIIVQLLQEGLKENQSKNAVDGKCCSSCSNGKNKHLQEQKVWILADTSYSPCCIDEVAAEHVASDLVIHFGDACLNKIEKLSAAYVFGKPYLDHKAFVNFFEKTYKDVNTRVCLMADAPYTHHLSTLYQFLKPKYENLVYADIDYSHSIVIDANSQEREISKFVKISNRLIYGLNEEDLKKFNENENFFQEYELFHINLPESPRLLELSTKFSTITCYDSLTGGTFQGPYPSLMKRYRYMHIARTAGTIGILVNTLSLSNTKQILNTVASWIKEAGKKHYMFVVGKPNVAKLANFETIDIWCVLGCGQSGIIIDNVGDYYKPIITPYELQVALKPEVSWSGKWVVDFKEVMSLDAQEKAEAMAMAMELESETGATNTDDTDYKNDEPEFDSVTGKYVSTSRPLRRIIQHLEIDSPQADLERNGNENETTQLVKKFSGSVAIKGTVSTSAISLQNRTWTGLGSDFKNDEDDENDIDQEGAIVQEGRGGVARSYNLNRQAYT
ncbi:hypothetical protein PACTADRAFT_43483 [Pachysolen tannophilus NRRL Y-2460]|uniref:2-(3-amino-3-carboxypropyl)histidine synthase subunit 2 n=1 Tax=Pachysolen tannophilus NRRL Y-2460 TaxID=669874 RepID=A0A1E4TSV0_PACTA|nr:hypothetical protein PACTADRAFT_43483 [Pachysolen tannophilus NRRL Y-2460]